ncbi:MAG: hypothetical protein RBR41_04720 [Desulfovibrio sp.]|uniref:hypothetical protein n=1 Tax=Desulfovibrio sp. TaxID=885 RepID=UPI002A35B2B2|nr:hypothetical protein [Desulfovibrio sp.]MDY0258952.1 hypothetical protein [Desulfovibrio sp.]
MSKTLITVDNLQDYVTGNRLTMDGSKILTAGARDELTRRGIEVTWADAPAESCCGCGCGDHKAENATACHSPEQEELLIGVAAIIKQHYNITDPEELKKVTLETVAAINGGFH